MQDLFEKHAVQGPARVPHPDTFNPKGIVARRSTVKVERRSITRHCDGQKTLLFALRGSARMVTIVDASGQGLRLSTQDHMEAGSQHWLLVEFRGIRVRFLVRVLWSRRTSEDFETGVRITPTSEAERHHAISYQHFIRRNPQAA